MPNRHEVLFDVNPFWSPTRSRTEAKSVRSVGSQIKGCGVTAPASLVAQGIWHAMLVGATPCFGTNRSRMLISPRHTSHAVPEHP